MSSEEQLINAIAQFVHDPLGYVYFNYPWGEGALKGEDGPDRWQIDILEDIRKALRTSEEAIQIAVASGHGIGKSALIAWIIQWFMSTRPYPQIVTTANTKTQLETKTWRELAKWHGMSRNAHWFKHTATKFEKISHQKTWFASAIPWSKERAEAFAGTHEKYVLMIYDEASLVDDVIWETTEGAMTTPGAMWIAFGNPTRNTGRFKECFGKLRHRWVNKQIDSRTAKKADQKQIRKWEEDYGEDSDFFRVRVKGMFPRASTTQFIPEDIVEIAALRKHEPHIYEHAPIILGCDVARFGDDQCVIHVRQGLATLATRKFREIDTMLYASHIMKVEDEFKADAVFVDVGAMGAGVIDRLRQLGREPIEVNFGSPAIDNNKYFNLRMEIWYKTREWLKSGGQIPNDKELKDDLTGPEYGFDAKERWQLEKKEDMKDRGLASPDNGDALALTFTAPVEKRADKKTDRFNERHFTGSTGWMGG